MKDVFLACACRHESLHRRTISSLPFRWGDGFIPHFPDQPERVPPRFLGVTMRVIQSPNLSGQTCYPGDVEDNRVRSRFLLAALSILAASPADARIDVRRLTCAEAQALVRREGAIVLTTGQYTYERFVAHRGFCQRDERLEGRRAATRDRESCRIGDVCTPGDYHGRRS